MGRGAAFGDLDNDGDIDIVVNEKDRHAAVLRNDTPAKNHWVRLVLQDKRRTWGGEGRGGRGRKRGRGEGKRQGHRI